jgi:hypothetical protein
MPGDKKAKKVQRHTEKQGEAEHRMASYRRAGSAYEHEVLYRALRPLGRPDILEELGRPLTAESVNQHPLLNAHYPLHLEIRPHGVSNPLPRPFDKPLPSLKRMLSEFPDTVFHGRCILPKTYRHPDDPFGYAVIFAYGEEGSMILHNRPDFTEGPARVTKELPNGCVVQIHDFAPFADDIADLCRHFFAEEGSALEDMIESNYPFREAFWPE